MPKKLKAVFTHVVIKCLKNTARLFGIELYTLDEIFTELRERMTSREMLEYLRRMDNVREMVDTLMEKYGVEAPFRPIYTIFALKIMKETRRMKKPIALQFAIGIKNYYVTTFDLNPEICQEIILNALNLK